MTWRTDKPAREGIFPVKFLGLQLFAKFADGYWRNPGPDPQRAAMAQWKGPAVGLPWREMEDSDGRA